MTAPAFRFLSLGAGVQSTALLLMSIDGHLPPIEHAIFADTGWEPGHVYEHLGRLMPEMANAGIQLHRVSAGNIRSDALDPTHRFASMPLFVQGDPWECDDCDGTGEVPDPAWGPIPTRRAACQQAHRSDRPSHPASGRGPDTAGGSSRDRPAPQAAACHRRQRPPGHQRRRARWGSKRNPLPSTTAEITPIEWLVIRTALEDRMRTMSANGAWAAHESARLVLVKVAAHVSVR